MDYYTRAQRIEEIPKLQDEWAKTQDDDKIWWEKKEVPFHRIVLKSLI